MRRTGHEAIHTRVRQGDKLKSEHSRAARKAELIRELDGSTHWEGCESAHPRCAELLDIAREERELSTYHQALDAEVRRATNNEWHLDVTVLEDDGDPQ